MVIFIEIQLKCFAIYSAFKQDTLSHHPETTAGEAEIEVNLSEIVREVTCNNLKG